MSRPLSERADDNGHHSHGTVVENKYEDELYGCSCFKPKCLQFMNSIRWHVFWQCIFNFFEGFIVNGIINIILPALEKRYGLSSSRSGFIASGNDIGALVVLLFVGYFGERRHKPRLMAIGIFIMCFGCLLFALPQFIGDKYSYVLSGQRQNMTDVRENLCSVFSTNNTIVCDSDTEQTVTDSNNGYYAMFVIGQILLGFGAVPMFTIGLTYIDENCKAKVTSFHISLTFCMAAIGVSIGFIVGGQTLGVFVDADKIDTSSVPLTPMDPQWVGAWWIGILIALVGLLISAIPISGYPKKLPGHDELLRSRKSEAHDDGTEEIVAQANFGKGWVDLPKMLLLLLKNPTFIFLCLGGTTEFLIVGGLATFGSKLIQQFHNVDLIRAGAIMGFVSIPGSGGGMLFGGYIVKKLKLKCRGIIRLCSACALICMLLGPSFLAFCPDGNMAGISSDYLSESSRGLVSPCNEDCGCSTRGFEPVCDSEGQSYFSPCHAGCNNIYTNNATKPLPWKWKKTTKVQVLICVLNTGFDFYSFGRLICNDASIITLVLMFYDCSCVNTTYSTIDTQVPVQVTPGSCTEECDLLYLFCVMLTLMMFFTFTNMSPTVTACFRCVPHKQRSFALAVQLIVLRTLGTFPGPIIVGAIIDKACDVWQETDCGVTGSCWIYRKRDLALYLICWWMCMKFIGSMFYFIASRVYIAPNDPDDS